MCIINIDRSSNADLDTLFVVKFITHVEPVIGRMARVVLYLLRVWPTAMKIYSPAIERGIKIHFNFLFSDGPHHPKMDGPEQSNWIRSLYIFYSICACATKKISIYLSVSAKWKRYIKCKKKNEKKKHHRIVTFNVIRMASALEDG